MPYTTISFYVADYSDDPVANVRVDFTPTNKVPLNVDGVITVPDTISVITDINGYGEVVLAQQVRFSARFATKSPVKVSFVTPETATANLIDLTDIDTPSDVWEDDGVVSWDDVTDKPATFPPSSHMHDISDVIGLADALASGGGGGTGVDGADGVGIASMTYSAATGVWTATMTDATTYQTGDLRGPAGQDGAQGPQGLQGPQGPQGDTGPAGSAGEQGPQGETGADGPQGVPGDDGASAYEIAVVNGFIGTEAQWLASLVGPQGDQGVAGQDGIDGADGADGANGVGVPAGGTTGQVLSKASGADYDTAWVNPAEAGSASWGSITGTLSAQADLASALAGKQDAGSYATAAQGSLADSAVQPADLASVATSGAYGDLSGLPTLGTAAAADAGDFAASVHTHAYSSLTGLPTLGTAASTDATAYATAAQGALADSATQPSDLAPVATSGAYADLDGKPDLFSGAWVDLSGVPSAFSPAAHTHETSEVSGLDSALGAKQPTLVSGTNIKTINGGSILGAGNLEIAGGGVSPSVLSIRPMPGRYLANVNGFQTAAIITQTADRLRLTGMVYDQTITVQSVGLRFSTSVPGGTAKVLIYTAHASDPDLIELFYESSDISTASTGYISVSASITFEAGKIYYIGGISSVSVGMAASPGGTINYGLSSGTQTGYNSSLSLVHSYAAAVPATISLAATNTTGTIAPFVPMLFA